MFLLRVAICQLVILAVSICARADSIPFRDSKLGPSIQLPRFHSASLPSIGHLLDSAIAHQMPTAQPQTRVVLLYADATGGKGSVRNANFLEWLFRMIGKLILPNHGRHHTKE